MQFLVSCDDFRGAPERSRTSSGHQREQHAADGRWFPASVVQQSRSCLTAAQSAHTACLSVCLSAWLSVRRQSVSEARTQTAQPRHEHGVLLTASIHIQSASAAESVRSVHSEAEERRRGGGRRRCWALQQTCRARSTSHWSVSLYFYIYHIYLFITPSSRGRKQLQCVFFVWTGHILQQHEPSKCFCTSWIFWDFEQTSHMKIRSVWSHRRRFTAAAFMF